MYRRNFVMAIPCALLLAACGGGDAPSGFARTVDVTLSDDMTIDLSDDDFARGEQVTFRVTNAGAARHEFMLGDAETQEHFAEEMGEGDMDHDTSNGVSVEPGATETFDYTFQQAGEILAGCHEPGHYEAGMVTSMAVADGQGGRPLTAVRLP